MPTASSRLIEPLAVRPRQDPTQPLRLLLVRNRGGDLPWLVRTITRMMAPVDVVEVDGLANALWRLGQERFDTVLLDLEWCGRLGIEGCKRQIADVVAVPVLDLSDDSLATAPPDRSGARPGASSSRSSAASGVKTRPSLACITGHG